MNLSGHLSHKTSTLSYGVFELLQKWRLSSQKIKIRCPCWLSWSVFLQRWVNTFEKKPDFLTAHSYETSIIYYCFGGGKYHVEPDEIQDSMVCGLKREENGRQKVKQQNSARGPQTSYMVSDSRRHHKKTGAKKLFFEKRNPIFIYFNAKRTS